MIKKTVLSLAFCCLGIFPLLAGGVKDSKKEDKSMIKPEYERVLNVMAKIRRGETVNIAAMGGSITTGYNSDPKNICAWASIVRDWWKNKGYDYNAEVNFMNEGVSGTDSAWGAARTKIHILDNDVDLVHLEFAMNDQWLEKNVRQRSYEGVIRQIMDNSDRAIMALFVNERNDPQPGQQYEQQPICEYYNIPFVSWKDCENNEKSGNVDWSDFFDGSESVHPNNEGHSEIAKFICQQLDEIWSMLPEDDSLLPKINKKLPKVLTDTGYQYLEFLTSADIEPLTNTGWKKGSPIHSEWVAHGGAKGGWSTTNELAEMTFKVKGSSVNILYSESDGFRNGQAWVEFADGTRGKKINLMCYASSRQGYLGWASRELCNTGKEEEFIVHIVCPKSRANDQGKETNVCGIIVTHLK